MARIKILDIVFILVVVVDIGKIKDNNCVKKRIYLEHKHKNTYKYIIYRYREFTEGDDSAWCLDH